MDLGNEPYGNARHFVSSQAPKDRNSRSSSGSGKTTNASTKHSVPVESTITRLLVATKQLLEGLAKWSRGETTEEEISMIYVKLGNEFNTACMAFAKEDIGMSELLSVPSDLRVCLETCLSEEPSLETLEQHLPKVRQIIIGLLHGLREKQRQYRENAALRRSQEEEAKSRPVSDHQRDYVHKSSAGSAFYATQSQDSTLTPNTAAKSREDLKKFVAQTEVFPAVKSRPTEKPTSPPPSAALIPKPPKAQSLDSRPVAQQDRVLEQGPPLRTTSMSGMRQTSSSARPPRSDRRGHSLDNAPPLLRSITMDSEPSSQSSFMTALSTDNHRMSLRSSISSDNSIGGYHQSVSGPAASSSDATMLPSASRPFSTSPSGLLNSSSIYSWDKPTSEVRTDMSSTAISSPVRSAMKSGNSLRPMSIQSALSDGEQPFDATIEGSIQSAAQIESLAALKSSDNLSRRASKRYSAYAIQKMTTGASPSRESPSRADRYDNRDASRSSLSAGREVIQRAQFEDLKSSLGSERSPRRGKSEFRPNRSHDGSRRDLPPPVPAIPASMSNSELHSTAVETILEEEDLPAVENKAVAYDSLKGEAFNEEAPALTNSVNSVREVDLSSSPSTTFSSEKNLVPREMPVHAQSAAPNSEPIFPISIYLQVGKEVKKAQLDETPTIAALRVLFIERFQYNPGHTDFPSIYVRDPIVGVHYELDDMSEVKSGSLLSLNIDSVEMVKQHIDQGLSTIAQDLKELRSTVSQMRRASMPASALFSPETHASPSIALAQAPSEKQYEEAARKVLGMIRNTPVLPSAKESGTTPPAQLDRDVPSQASEPLSDDQGQKMNQRTVQGNGQEFQSMVSTLKTQHDEVTSLRRDIGVLRQIYGDFTTETKAMFSNVRAQTSHVQNLAATKISTARSFINAGKSKLETETESLIVKGDDLQDAIEQMREDILKKIRPRPGQLREISDSLATVTKRRGNLVAWIGTVKPSWKATWSDELETIINEQKQLETSESLLDELGVDLREAEVVLANIQQVSKQPNSRRSAREFVPAPATDDHQGLSTVLLEVQALEPDANRRLEAIAKAEKQREIELATRTDEFAAELGGFVSGGKLKKSGGIEEAERIRQARSEATLKAMFSSIGGLPAVIVLPTTSGEQSDPNTSID